MMSFMNLISKIKIKEGKITIVANPDFTRDYLRQDFEAIYTNSEGKPLQIDEDKAAVPFIVNVAPVIWLAGITTSVEELDYRFVDSLEEMKKIYKMMYPAHGWDGKIIVKKRIKGAKKSKLDNAAVLFSGGVDSVYTSIFCGGDNQTLVTVRGADIPLDNDTSWLNVQKQSREFADIYNFNNLFIDSNFARFLDTPKFMKFWPDIGDWWTAVQHGPAFLGLMAPAVSDSSQVFIASTHTKDFKGPWGSNPKIDEACGWGNVVTSHHGYDTTRQEKINRIVHKTSAKKKKPFLRVCVGNSYGDGGNCMRCEKCLRTFAGLLVAGAVPADYGLELSTDEAVTRIKKRFYRHTMPMTTSKKFIWQDIQNNAKNIVNSSKYPEGDSHVFYEWIKSYDFNKYYKRAKIPYRIRKRLVRLAKSNQILEKIVRKSVAKIYKLNT